MILNIIRNYSKKANDNIAGYVPLFGTKASREPITLNFNAEIDNYAKEKFEFFIKEVTSRHIPLYVIISPAFVNPFPDTKSEIATKEILARYNVPLWDYSIDTTFRKRKYFYDNVHLNEKGAAIFSEFIAKRIKDSMEKDNYGVRQ
jgi:lysophospholipase L1-like esterase